MRNLLLLLVFTMVAQLGVAQDRATNKLRAATAIETLQEGVLVMRLTSNRKKMAAIEKHLAELPGDSPKRARLEKILEDTRIKTKKENETIVKIIKGEFDFAPVFFIYDYDADQLADGKQSGYFLNENLDYDASINLPSTNYLIMYVGQPDYAQSSGVKSLLIADANSKDLAPPFPYAQAIEHAGFLLKLFMNKETAYTKTMVKAINKMNNNLHIFAQKVAQKKQEE